MAGYAGLQCLTETKDVLNRAKGGRCLLMVNAFFLVRMARAFMEII